MQCLKIDFYWCY